MPYDESVLNDLRIRHRVSEIVGRYVSLKKRGREHEALCPFHKEKTPSFTVNDAKRFAHCFGCGWHGDIFQFVMDIEGVKFPEAVARITGEAPPPTEKGERPPDPAPDPPAEAIKWYKDLPTYAEAVYDYIDADGKLRFKVARIPKEKAPGKKRKQFWTYTPAKKKGAPGWAATQRMDRDRPLYRLGAALTANSTIHVFEGEKCVDRFLEAVPDAVAVTCCGGSQAWQRTDWTPLHGRDVLLVADENEAGRRMMLGLAELLSGKVASLEIALPEGDSGDDIADQIARGGKDAAIEYIARWAEPYEPAPPPPEPYNGPVPLTMAQKFARGDYQRPWLIEGLLPIDGLGLIAAQPKVGKSTFTRCLALAVARGEDFLGRAVRQGPALVVSLEDSDNAVAAHMRGIGSNENDQVLWLSGEDFDPDPGRRLDELESVIVQYGTKLAIIDPIFRFIAVQDADSYAEVGKALAPLLEMSRRRETSIMISHHNRKAGGEYGTQVLGSTAIFASVDTLISLRRDGKMRTIETTQREGEDMEETVLHLDLQGWASLGGTRQDAKRRDAEEAILHILEKARAPMTTPQIIEASGRQRKIVLAALNKLVQDFGVKQRGSGSRSAPFQYEHPSVAVYARREQNEDIPL